MSLVESIKFVGTNTKVVIQLMQELFKHSGALKVTIQPWSDKRTLSANAQQHVWYAQIAKESGDDVKSVESFCKLMFGLPIVINDPNHGDKVRYFLDGRNFFDWPHEKQCAAMPYVQVTSLMTTKQHNEFRDNMMNYFNKAGFNLDYT